MLLALRPKDDELRDLANMFRDVEMRSGECQLAFRVFREKDRAVDFVILLVAGSG